MKTNPPWALLGRRDTFRGAHDMALEILRTHSPEPLDPGKAEIVRKTFKELVQ